MSKLKMRTRKKINRILILLNKLFFNSYWIIIFIYFFLVISILGILTKNNVYSYIEKNATIFLATSEGTTACFKLESGEIDEKICLEESIILWSLKGDDTRYVAESVKTDGNGGVHLYISPEDGVGYQKILEEKADEIVVLVPAKIVPLWHRLVDYVL